MRILAAILMCGYIWLVAYSYKRKQEIENAEYPQDWFKCSGGCDNCDEDCEGRI